VKRACFPVFQIIGETLKTADEIYNTNIINNSNLQVAFDFKDQSIKSLKAISVGSNQSKIFVFLSNRDSSDIPLAIELNGKRVANTINYKYVSNPDLSATNGGNEVIPGRGKNEVTIQSWNGSADQLRIPGNSFGVIELQ
ncbi:MAG: hypothetical protein WBV73_15310, partial [Phormidium sp.]